MDIVFDFYSIGLKFTAIGRYHKGFRGTYEEPPEPGELEIERFVHSDTKSDVTFLLDSTVVDQLYEDAYDALVDHFEEERACAAEAKFEQRREEERMCRSC